MINTDDLNTGSTNSTERNWRWSKVSEIWQKSSFVTIFYEAQILTQRVLTRGEGGGIGKFFIGLTWWMELVSMQESWLNLFAVNQELWPWLSSKERPNNPPNRLVSSLEFPIDFVAERWLQSNPTMQEKRLIIDFIQFSKYKMKRRSPKKKVTSQWRNNVSLTISFHIVWLQKEFKFAHSSLDLFTYLTRFAFKTVPYLTRYSLRSVGRGGCFTPKGSYPSTCRRYALLRGTRTITVISTMGPIYTFAWPSVSGG